MGRLVVAGGVLVGLAALGASAALSGCHLADSPDPVKCDAGAHPVDGHCATDDLPAATLAITLDEAGTSCAVTPDSITVAAAGAFAFINQDSADHVVTGADGQAWATVKAGQNSPFITITKAGRWPFTVSGCAKGGTVVVQ